MVVDINTPPFESRMAILRSKAGENIKYFDDKVLELIAETVQSSIRELEGVLTTLITQAQFRNTVLTVNDVKLLIRNNIKSKKNVSITDIIKNICAYYQIDEQLLYSKTRRKDVVKPRQIIMYLLRQEYDISYPVIGEKLGGRDHTTVIHSFEKIRDEIKTNASLSREIEEIRSILV
jgi:chromosomal replication initiator protein